MKVRKLIEQFEKLDRDCNIFILYDGCYILEPDIDVATDEDVELLSEDYPQVQVGDYLIKS